MNYKKNLISSTTFAIISAVVSGAIIYMCFQLIGAIERSTNFEATPGETIVDDDGFPEVDWSYWQRINSDIVGWITIPGTAVDYPIVQAHTNDPTHYLYYDVYGEWNPLGAIYLDADAEENGFKSQNAVIFGHSMIGAREDETRMFSSVIQYNKQEFAEDHKRVLIQTPSEKIILDAFAVNNINANNPEKYTEFNNKDALEEYVQNVYSESVVDLTDEAPLLNRMITLCTCSYNFNPSNERTLVYLQAKGLL